MIDEDRIAVVVTDGPEVTLGAIVDCARRLLERTRISVGTVAGLGISVPGPVDPDTARPSQPPILPGRDAYPIPENLSDQLRVPVLVANDADAAALGEQRSGHPGSRSLFFLKVSSGIGAGIVLGSHVYVGTDGGAGDIGHVKVPGETELCQGGARGCLAALASGRAVARTLTKLGKPAASASDVGAYLAAEDHDATQLTQAAGRAIGEVMATVVSLLNPTDLVVGGMLASSGLIPGCENRCILARCLLPRGTSRSVSRYSASVPHWWASQPWSSSESTPRSRWTR